MQPFRQDVPEVLAAADIFVLPSLWEVFPIALLEAMSMGKTVIATNVGGTPEMVRHGFNGWLVDVNDLHTELVRGLLTVCRDEKLRENLRINAIKSVYNQYSVQTLARKNESIYEGLMETSPSHLQLTPTL